MTPAEFCARMRQIRENPNLSPQERHAQMDALMCALFHLLDYSH